MKQLLVLRHAKSAGLHCGGTDHGRDLNDQGRRDALRMGRLIAARDLAPDLVLCSTALRTRETAQRVIAGGDLSAELRFCDDLYPTNAEAALALLQSAPVAAGCVLVVAHQPGVEDLVEAFSGMPVCMPTAAMVHMRLAVDGWSDAAFNERATIADVWCPRDLSDD